MYAAQDEKGKDSLVYAPTSDAKKTETEKDQFYDNLEKIRTKERDHYNIAMGDWNAKVGEGRSERDNIGEYGLGNRNRNETRLIEFCIKKQPNHCKRLLKKKKKPKNSNGAGSPQMEKSKNEIDYIIVINDRSIVKNVATLSRLKFKLHHKIRRGNIGNKVKNGYKRNINQKSVIPCHKLEVAKKEPALKMQNLTNMNKYKPPQEFYDKVGKKY